MRYPLALAGATTLAILPTAALAETIDVTPGVFYGLDLLEAVLGVAITVLGGLAAAFLRPWVGDRIATGAMDRLERMAHRAVTAARMRYLDRTWSVEVENDILAYVVEYLGQQAPKDLAAWKMTPNAVRDFAAAILGEQMAMLPPEELPEGYRGAQGIT